MQKKELFSTLITGLVIAIIVFFALVFNFSYTLIKNLSGYDNAMVVFESNEDNRYQLLRLNRSFDQTVSYALFSEDQTLEFVFRNAFLVEVYRITEEDLLSDDYVVFEITEQHRNPLSVDIYKAGVFIERQTFTYLEDYAESELLVYRFDFNHLMIKDDVIKRGIIDIKILDVALTITITTLATIVLYMLLIKKRNINLNEDQSEKPRLHKIVENEVLDDSHAVNTSSIIPKLKKYASVLVLNLVFAIPLTIIMIASIVYIFGASEVEPENKLYFSASQNNYEINVYIGINQSIANDSDYGLETVFYTIEFNEAFVDLHIATIQCGNQYVGRAFSDSGLAYANTTDVYYRQIDMWRFEDCKDADTFRIIVRNPNTGTTILTSNTYKLYKEALEVQHEFDITKIEDQTIYLIGLYIFNVVVTVPLIKIGIKKNRHKKNIEQLNNQSLDI